MRDETLKQLVRALKENTANQIKTQKTLEVVLTWKGEDEQNHRLEKTQRDTTNLLLEQLVRLHLFGVNMKK